MIKLTDHQTAKVVKVKCFQQMDGDGIIVTFGLEDSYIIKKRFFLHKPWEAWSFAQLMKLCNNATHFQEMEGKSVRVILAHENGDSVAAICDEIMDVVYPCHPYGTFFMKEYTMDRFLRDWDIE